MLLEELSPQLQGKLRVSKHKTTSKKPMVQL